MIVFDGKKTLRIHETFQETLQGEGFWTGHLVDFVRLYGCNVGCPWCDTGYASGSPLPEFTNLSIDELILELKSERVVISGGEPMLQPAIVDLCEAVIATGKKPHIETSGSSYQAVPMGCWVTLSPKQHLNPLRPVLDAAWKRADEVKLVISSRADFDFYYPTMMNVLNFSGDCQLFLQPEWGGRETAMPLILSLIREYPMFRMSLQTHKVMSIA